MKKARAVGYACPDGVGIGVKGKFTGATVLNAERGAYLDDIVSGLDYMSREFTRLGAGRWASHFAKHMKPKTAWRAPTFAPWSVCGR